MDTYHLRIFQRQVLDQCQFLVWAAQDINTGLNTRNIDRVLYGIQNLLNAGANISKMFWGQRGKFADKRKRLRDSIGVSDSSPLRNVTMRNNFEHMDDRIDRWWAESKQHNHIGKVLGPRNSIEGADPMDIFRWFDPSTADVIFWGEAFNIQELVNEAQTIIPKLLVEAAKPHWDQPDPK